jgi:uncharacterized protein (UPF0261 family)
MTAKRAQRDCEADVVLLIVTFGLQKLMAKGKDFHEQGSNGVSPSHV